MHFMALGRTNSVAHTRSAKARISSSYGASRHRSSKKVLIPLQGRGRTLMSTRNLVSRGVFDSSDDWSFKRGLKSAKDEQDYSEDVHMMSEDEENINSDVEEQLKVFGSPLSSTKADYDEESDGSASSASSSGCRRCVGSRPSPDTTTTDSRDLKKVRSVAVRVNHGFSSDGDSTDQTKGDMFKDSKGGKGDDQATSRKSKMGEKRRESPDSPSRYRSRREGASKSSKKRRSSSSDHRMSRSSRSESPPRRRETRPSTGHRYTKHHTRMEEWDGGGRRTSFLKYQRDFRGRGLGCRPTMGHTHTDMLNGVTQLPRSQPLMQTPILGCHHCNNSLAVSSCMCTPHRLHCSSAEVVRCRGGDPTSSSNPLLSSSWKMDCKIYIGNLGEDATRMEIREVFRKYGRLRNLWIAKKPPGFAFVEYDRPKDARLAVKEANGKLVCGVRIKVQMSTSERHINDVAQVHPRQHHHEPRSRDRTGRHR